DASPAPRAGPRALGTRRARRLRRRPSADPGGGGRRVPGVDPDRGRPQRPAPLGGGAGGAARPRPRVLVLARRTVPCGRAPRAREQWRRPRRPGLSALPRPPDPARPDAFPDRNAFGTMRLWISPPPRNSVHPEALPNSERPTGISDRAVNP